MQTEMDSLPTHSVSTDPSATVFLDEGRRQFAAGNYDESESLVLRALNGGADESVCRLYLARICNLGRRWDGSLEHWQWLRNFDPSKLEPQLQVARALFRLDRWEEAAVGFRAVLALDQEHPEARARLAEIERSAGIADYKEGIQAFREGDYGKGAYHFLRALETKTEEVACHQHLARIYNQEQEWAKAMTHWSWLSQHDATKVEPHLQIGRIHFKYREYKDATLAFNKVLGLEARHEEAQQTIQKIDALQQEETFLRTSFEDDNWLSLVPNALRWPLSEDLLEASASSIDMLIDQAARQAVALSQLVSTYSEANGDLGGHRRLYGEQNTKRLEELVELLQTARKSARAVTRRTDRLMEVVDKFSGRRRSNVPAPRNPLSRTKWRETMVALALEVHQEHGTKATVAWVLRQALLDDRQIIFSLLADALREKDQEATLQFLWLSYGEKPTPENAERLASKMFQAGNLSDTGALLRGAPKGTSAPFVIEMHSSVARFRDGVAIPAPSSSPPPGPRVAYVASGSLPFQVSGYTTRTHEIVSGLVKAGVDCVCFTRPGFPWDRSRGQTIELDSSRVQKIGEVTYIHTELPGVSAAPGKIMEEASDALERHFRNHRIGIVHAASNSRNALPALIAARRVGAKFIYEVRGLWELTAASRFVGWETTERFELDRNLEVLASTNADYVLTITKGVAEELVKDGVSPDRLALLPNAVDPQSFRPIPKDRALMERLGLTDDDFTAVYAGSLLNYEGLDDLIVAVSILRRSNVPARVIIVGDGAVRSQLEALTAELGLQKAVTFIGRVKPDEIEAYLSVADVVPIPRKPFKVCMVVSPLKPFEAMAMAKAVILSDLPALREIVSDGETGLICKPADPVDLAATLARLARDPELRKRLGESAREWIEQNRTWHENALRLIRLYRDMNGAEAPAQPAEVQTTVTGA
jgi:glycosyltransferase involved in cell wall biosynthesis/tetratricopeptide (TPR) repeat protein